MNTSIYIPDELTKRLDRYLKYSDEKTSKNAIVVKALDEYLTRREANTEWSDRFLEWQGHPGLEIEREKQDRE